jgi:hypothetical protein
MPLFTDGPIYELEALLTIANNRLVFPSEMKLNYLLGPIRKAPGDEPVSDEILKEAVDELKRIAPVLYEKNKKTLTKIQPLPRNWKSIRQKRVEKEVHIKQDRSAKSHEQWVKREDAINEIVSPIFTKLLDIGTRKAFDEIKDVPGAGILKEIIKVTWSIHIRSFFESLNQNEKAAFVKAIAAYESSIPDGLNMNRGDTTPYGSTTVLQFFIPELPKRCHDSVLDWVLRNTWSYKYYSTAPNIKVWRERERANKERRENAIRKRREKSIELENKRKEEIAKRKANAATINLLKAISRNDLDWAHALLKKGARIRKADTVGLLSLAGHARTIGKNEVAEDIEESIRKTPKGLFDN